MKVGGFVSQAIKLVWPKENCMNSIRTICSEIFRLFSFIFYIEHAERTQRSLAKNLAFKFTGLKSSRNQWNTTYSTQKTILVIINFAPKMSIYSIILPLLLSAREGQRNCENETIIYKFQEIEFSCIMENL